MRKNGQFLAKNDFSIQNLEGLFYHKKRTTFVVGYGFLFIKIISEPASPALVYGGHDYLIMDKGDYSFSVPCVNASFVTRRQ